MNADSCKRMLKTDCWFDSHTPDPCIVSDALTTPFAYPRDFSRKSTSTLGLLVRRIAGRILPHSAVPTTPEVQCAPRFTATNLLHRASA